MSADTFRRLAALNLTNDQIAGVLEIMEADSEVRKAKGRDRWHRWKAKKDGTNVSKHLPTTANVSSQLARVEGSSSKEEISREVSKEERTARGARLPVHVCFSEFWDLYPNKVGKREAEKAFTRATMRASATQIIAGLRRYVAKTDDRPWCNPATWLNQDRWDDQPAATVARVSTGPPPKPTPYDALREFSKLKGWTDEQSSSNGDLNDVGQLSKDNGGGEIVSLRGGIGGHYR